MSVAGATIQAAAPPERLPRLLAEVGEAWVDLASHRRRAGPIPKAGRQPRIDLIDAIGRAGLRGKGGGAFPTARKMEAVASGPGRPVVLVNGGEGEPASGKDKLLLTRAPHVVLDGALIAAAAIGAREVVVCVDRHADYALESVQRALSERLSTEPTPVPVRLVAVPTHYVSGEETALVRWLNGGEAKPTSGPRPFERGVGGRPTLVDNVETLAHAAQIIRWGPEWFRSAGTRAEPGSTLLTVSGAVVRPGVYEVPVGASVARVLQRAGAIEGDVSAVLVGGYFGTWLTAEQAAEAHMSCNGLAPYGAAPGSGVVVALPRDACGVVESARVVSWMAASTAGQCGSCVNGLASIAHTAGMIARGRAPRDAAMELVRWAGQIDGRGACRLPDGAARFLRSSLATFQNEVDRHLRGAHCPGQRHVLPLPDPVRDTWR
ncbi:MAG: SLBB domain-containing protein, partial [Acidimicrobiia bacterium]|nr:SLBB domain-containing protein [Acidimicrobiia bacterium]